LNKSPSAKSELTAIQLRAKTHWQTPFASSRGPPFAAFAAAHSAGNIRASVLAHSRSRLISARVVIFFSGRVGEENYNRQGLFIFHRLQPPRGMLPASTRCKFNRSTRRPPTCVTLRANNHSFTARMEIIISFYSGGRKHEMISQQTTTAAATAAANRATGAAAKLLVFRFCFNAYFMSSVTTLEPVTVAYYIKEQTVLQGEERRAGRERESTHWRLLLLQVCARARFNLCQWPCIRRLHFRLISLCGERRRLRCLVNTILTNMALSQTNAHNIHTHTCCL
jgi:hypothetical protein